MGKKIVWSPTSLRQLEEVHEDILQVSKSLNTADKIVNEIMDSAEVLFSQPEIYSLDENKLNNDGTYRSYEIKTYNVAYRVLSNFIHIIRVRYSGKEPKLY